MTNAKRPTWLNAVGFLVGVLLSELAFTGHAGLAPAKEWIAELDQPCGASPVCFFHFEVWFPGETEARASLDVPAEGPEGCGHQQLDVSALVNAMTEGPPNSMPELRVWSVNCAGVRSEPNPSPDAANHCGYEWVYLDLLGYCGDTGTGSIAEGDANHSGDVDLSDPIFILNYMFRGGPLPCGDPDPNRDGDLDLADAITLLMRLFG